MRRFIGLDGHGDPRGRKQIMNRSHFFQLCSKQLATLCTQVEMLGKLNILNLHLHCEDFYAGLLNRLFNLKLVNANAIEKNADGIDLVDSIAKVILQVSATATTTKINSALGKDLSTYTGHGFRFMSISKDASVLRKATYTNPHGLIFVPAQHIYDVTALLDIILHMDLPKQRDIYAFLREELSDTATDEQMKESNLASIINIISKEDFSADSPGATTAGFNVEFKVTHNGLLGAAGVIEDYKVFHHRVDRIYAEFDINAVNKSRSVLDAFRRTYCKLRPKYVGDELFFQIVDHVMTAVQQSSNYIEIPLDELELCVSVLAVDAFIRCKIFEKPPEAKHAVT